MLHQSFDIECIVAGAVAAFASYAVLAFSRRSSVSSGASGDVRSDGVIVRDRYRQIAEALQEMVWTATPGGHIDYGNRAWFNYSGITGEALAETAWQSTLHPDDTAIANARWLEAIATGNPHEAEYRIRRATDGEYRWHLCRATALRDQNGVIEKWLGTATDIHEQKRAEGVLRDGQRLLEGRIADHEAQAQAATELYQLLAENATDMVSTHKADGAFDYATPSWSEFTGIGELGGHYPAELSHPDDLPTLVTNYRRGLVSDELITTAWRCRRTDGRYGWLETTTRAVREPASSRIRAFVCATRDVTERKQAESAVHESEARYRQLLELAAEAILIADAAGECVEANARASTLLGRTEAELIGVPVASLFVASDTDTLARFSLLGVGEVIIADDVAVRTDGTMVAVELSIAMLPAGGMQIIARDVSSRKELDRLKSEFVSVVSHELRTPLTSIRGALGLLASGRLAATPGTSARMLDLAVTNTDRLIRLINDILDAERIDSGIAVMERAWCDATDVAHEVAESLRPTAERAQVNVRVIAEPTLAWVDRDRLTQTLTNLVGNAIKFSPKGGVIEVRITADAQDVRFEVRDNGRGIPADKLESIFERFQQVDGSDARAKGGTGLGLAISRSIVRQHGGKIWVESVFGQGSVFCLTIPLPPAPRQEPASATHGNILVCDDDPGFLEVIREMLERRGYSVATATSGPQLIERVKVARPTAILLDIVMPGMSGRETLEALQSTGATRNIPVIVLSGAVPIQDAKHIGAIDWLAKPIDDAALTRALALIGNPKGATAARVLVVEDDRALAQVIATTLESRGYTVNVTHNGAETLSCFRAVGADVLIVDNGLSDMTGLEVLESIRSDVGPLGMPAILYATEDLDVVSRDRVDDAGALIAIKSRTSPEALVDMVARLLRAEQRVAAIAG